MPKKTNVVALSVAQRTELETLIRSGTCSAHTHTHARILLKADGGADGPAWTDKMICLALDVGPRPLRACVKPLCKTASRPRWNANCPTGSTNVRSTVLPKRI